VRWAPVVLLWLLPACGPAEQEPAPPVRPAPDQPGPYAVGVTTVESEGVVEVWYPAVDPGTEPDPYPDVPYALGAHRDADPDRRGAPYPLVAFSHGFGGIRYQSAFLTEHLAAHGFVVVAPDHRHNTMLDLDESMTGQVLVERPGDIARAVDLVPELPGLVGLAAAESYAVVGHSFGGVTALLVGGGELDVGYAQAHCDEHHDRGCAFFTDGEIGDPELASPDPRAVVAVDLCPGGWYAFGTSGLDGLGPTLAVAGDRDQDLPYDREGRPTMDALPAPKHLVVLADAGHWGVTDLCALAPVIDECRGAEAGWMEPHRAQAIVRTLVTAYAGDALLDDPQYASWLVPDAWPDADVELEVVP